MPDPDDDDKKPLVCPDLPDGFRTGLPVNMTLEDVVELTGEMEHLNELVVLSIERQGGFSGTDAYFTMVQPILDLLELEIRVRFRQGMSRDEMKLVIQDWIDDEIRRCRK